MSMKLLERDLPLKTKSGVPLQKINPAWTGKAAIVAATGPSLTQEVAKICRSSGLPTIVVNDAHRLLPWADILYACDELWWRTYKGCPEFKGQKWSSHGAYGSVKNNNKDQVAEQYGLNLIAGEDGAGFSEDPRVIRYGSNSGFQALNLGLHFNPDPIILVGFNMQMVDKKRHFFGDHPTPLRNSNNYESFAKSFNVAAKKLKRKVTILNATPNSALTAFPKVDLYDTIASLKTQRSCS